MVATLRGGKISYILAGIGLMLLWYVITAFSYKAVYEIVGETEDPHRLLLLAPSAFFMNIIAPSGGMSGIALFIKDGRERGHSSAKLTVATGLNILFDYIGFLVVLILGMGVLARLNQLNWTEITASILFLLISLGISALLYLGNRSEAMLERVLVAGTKFINKLGRPFIHRDYIPMNRTIDFSQEAAEGLSALRKTSSTWVKPFLLALANKATLIGIFTMMFLAFDVPFTIETVVAGFSIGYLFQIISPTPSGIGFMEGILTLALNGLGISLGDAAIIVAAYRGITFWLPLVIGMITFHFYETRNKMSSVSGR